MKTLFLLLALSALTTCAPHRKVKFPVITSSYPVVYEIRDGISDPYVLRLAVPGFIENKEFSVNFIFADKAWSFSGRHIKGYAEYQGNTYLDIMLLTRYDIWILSHLKSGAKYSIIIEEGGKDITP